jgi:iron complex outermembrane receptor protein
MGGMTVSLTPLSPRRRGGADETIRTPEFTANLGGTYSAIIPWGGLTFSGNANYISSLYRDAANRIESPGYTIINGRISFTPTGKPYEIAVYAKNLTDVHYAAYTVDSTLGDRIDYAPPLTYGFKVSYKF